MPCKATILCVLTLVGARSLWAQDVTAVVDRDIRLFAMSAALNAAGFDVELAPRYHPVRQLLRESLSEVDPELVRRLRDFYDAHRGSAPEADQLAPYLSLALSVTPPPEMEPLNEDSLIPLDAREVEEFLPLVRELYSTAGLTSLWASLAPGYDVVLDRLAEPIRETLVGIEAYLRVPAGMSGGRQAVILLELSLPINSVNLRNYPDSLYVVLGDSGSPPVDVIGHGYLHVLLDSLVAAHRGQELSLVADLETLVEGVDGVRAEYSSDPETMTTESLIRAVELRMEEGQGREETAKLDLAYREGLLLAPFFYEQLGEFEAGEVGIRQAFPEIIRRLDPTREYARFDERFFAIPVPVTAPVRAEIPAPPPVPEDPSRALLEQAQTAFNAGDNAAAEELFSRVLTDLNPQSGAAFYGLALIASRNQDSDRAREYFGRTIASGTAEASMVAWSHVYLGRMDDIICSRENALGHYRLALGFGDANRGAADAARDGIAAAYGGGC